MTISVIVSTFNQPERLEKVLLGYQYQTINNFEVVIADDGSGEETRNLINRYKEMNIYPIQHVWHEDDGFRKSTILNKAISASKGEYLVITDGDCVPRADFLEVHQNNAQEGHFISGGMFRLTLDVAEKITFEDIKTQRCFDVNYLHKLGQPKKLFKDLKCKLKRESYKKIANTITPANASWNGHNSSGWKTDIIRVNGFDERMRYGGQDRELGERLMNFGIKGKQLRFSAICLHLEHKRGYVTKEDWARNYQIRKETKEKKANWTPYGLLRRTTA